MLHNFFIFYNFNKEVTKQSHFQGLIKDECCAPAACGYYYDLPLGLPGERAGRHVAELAAGPPAGGWLLPGWAAANAQGMRVQQSAATEPFWLSPSMLSLHGAGPLASGLHHDGWQGLLQLTHSSQRVHSVSL